MIKAKLLNFVLTSIVHSKYCMHLCLNHTLIWCCPSVSTAVARFFSERSLLLVAIVALASRSKSYEMNIIKATVNGVHSLVL